MTGAKTLKDASASAYRGRTDERPHYFTPRQQHRGRMLHQTSLASRLVDSLVSCVAVKTTINCHQNLRATTQYLEERAMTGHNTLTLLEPQFRFGDKPVKK